MRGMELETPERLDDLPIFPLATVLFPGAILPLHIFEDRYKEMMRFALDNGGLFGLSYKENAFIGRETPPEVGSVGCLARINAVMPVEEDRMNIISTGIVRYRVRGLNQVQPFILARVEPFTDDIEHDEDLTALYKDQMEMYRKFIAASQALDEASMTFQQELPEEPEALSLLIASVLPIENHTKQQLLEMTSTRVRFTRLRPFVLQALASYTKRIEIIERAKSNGHAKLQ
jgi:Lon protease-like protein